LLNCSIQLKLGRVASSLQHRYNISISCLII